MEEVRIIIVLESTADMDVNISHVQVEIQFRNGACAEHDVLGHGRLGVTAVLRSKSQTRLHRKEISRAALPRAECCELALDSLVGAVFLVRGDDLLNHVLANSRPPT